MNVAEIVIAASLVALVLVFVRISWTLKEINDTLASGGRDAGTGAIGSAAKGSGRTALDTDVSTSGGASLSENELAAVIAVAWASYREAV